MEPLHFVKLYFTRLGGRDVPMSYNWNDKFGFNIKPDSSGIYQHTQVGAPLYEYSLMELLNSFESPISYTVKNTLSAYKNITNLIVIETADNHSAREIVINTTFWKKVIKLIELVFENQELYLGHPTISGGGYHCRGDQILSTVNPHTDTQDLIDVGNENGGIYKKNSLHVKMVQYPGTPPRIKSFSFEAIRTQLSEEERKEDPEDTLKSTIRIDGYFDPEAFIEEATVAKYKVYTYEDLRGTKESIDDYNLDISIENGARTTTEFDAAITYKLEEILSGGKYRSHVRYCPTKQGGGATFYIDQGEYKIFPGHTGKPAGIYVGDTLVTSENQEKYGYYKPFYIFSSLNKKSVHKISERVQKQEVIKYINSVMFTPSQDEEKKKRFPNLFNDTMVEIYPILENKYKETIVHGLNAQALNDKLMKINVIEGSKIGDCEIFSLGVGPTYSFGNKNYLNLSYIAVERSLTGNKDDVSSIYKERPITGRFPKFMPLRNGQYDNVPKDTIVFHDLCVLAMSLLMGDITMEAALKSVENIRKEDPIPADTYSLADESSQGDKVFSFIFKGTKYRLIKSL